MKQVERLLCGTYSWPKLLLCLFLACGAGWAQDQTSRFVYDDKGRLRAVIAPNGEAAIYEYDAAGNFTAIRRNTATQLELLGFTPREGPTGTTVTIYGTGLTAGVSSVAFNGVSATIISASASSVTATVPGGATTGPISVVTPNGTAATSQSFTVVPCVPLPANGVSWFRAENNANDDLGVNNGALQNGATFAAGQVGRGFSLDGTNDVVEVLDSPTLDFAPGAPITVELWAFRTSTNSTMHLLGKRSGCAGTGNYQMALNTASGEGLIFGAGLGNEVQTGQNLPLSTWTHLAGTFDGTTYRFYINGILRGTGTGTLGTANNATLKIGGSGTCATFGGVIDEATIYNRALTQSEIQSVFNAGSNGKCPTSLAINGRSSDAANAVGSNVSVTLSGAISRVATIDNDSNYTFENLTPDSHYTVIPNSPYITSSLPRANFRTLSANQTQNFAVQPVSPALIPPLMNNFPLHPNPDHIFWNLVTLSVGGVALFACLHALGKGRNI